jgi:hypothetical protein
MLNEHNFNDCGSRIFEICHIFEFYIRFIYIMISHRILVSERQLYFIFFFVFTSVPAPLLSFWQKCVFLYGIYVFVQ